MRRLQSFVAAMVLLAAGAAPVLAALVRQVGPYRVALTTRPEIVPSSGHADLVLRITDRAGKPLEGLEVRAITRMPGMPMGEREQPAAPKPGEPGAYVAPASFPMAGGYEVGLKVSGSAGTAEGVVALQTGQDTSVEPGGLHPGALVLWAGLAAIVLFVLHRMRATGQRLNWRVMASRRTVTGLLLVAGMLAIVVYAVRNWRREGAMTPIEAQAMEMSTPAPPGTHTVELAEVAHGPVESLVRYSGQAVAYNEVDVQPRVQGWIVQMGVYQGDRVRRGQWVARLDTSQVDPQVAEREAMLRQAERGVEVARSEAREAREAIAEAHAEVGIRRAAIEEAQAMLEAARQERAGAESDLNSARSMVADAESMQEAARADQRYWRQELERMRRLLDQGAVSTAEFQMAQAQAQMADAKVRQTQAAVARAESEVQAAQSALRRADAMARAAQKKVDQAEEELQVHYAHVKTSRAAAEAAARRVAAARADVDRARAGVRGVATVRGYTALSSPVDGVVTQRIISPGVLVGPGQAVLRIAQLEPIRLQANVAAADLAQIRLGSPARVFERDGGRKPAIVRVTSIAPAVDPAARTAVVEALHPNQDRRFLPGQFITMEISTGREARTLRVPRRAIQWRTEISGGVLSDETKPYVWIAEPAGAGLMTVRQVDFVPGVRGRDYVQVRSGLTAGQQVVITGAAALRSGDRVVAVNPPAVAAAPPEHSLHGAGPQTAAGEVNDTGFHPPVLSLKHGVPARITFTRTSDKNCGTEVIFPDYGIRKPLPLNQHVVVEITPRAGEFRFTCGMDMLKGRLVVR